MANVIENPKDGAPLEAFVMVRTRSDLDRLATATAPSVDIEPWPWGNVIALWLVASIALWGGIGAAVATFF
jgi:hypothetical protein